MSGVSFAFGVDVGRPVGSAAQMPDGFGSVTSTEISCCWSDGDLS